MQLHLAVKAGIGFDEGLLLMLEEEGQHRAPLKKVGALLGQGEPLWRAFEQAGVFPRYMVGMIEAGERSGRLEQVFLSLSAYYEERSALKALIRSAVFFPSLLFLMVMCVVAVLLIVVLPIFNEVFLSLGAPLPLPARLMLEAGFWLKRARYGFLTLLLALAALTLVFWLWPAANRQYLRLRNRLFERSQLAKKIGAARFAGALAMGTKSGLQIDEALKIGERLCENTAISARIGPLRQAVGRGVSLADALLGAQIFEPLFCKMIVVGTKTGTLDTVMTEVARRADEQARLSVERAVGRVEPTLIIIMSTLIGVLLLSTLLPMLGAMRVLGG